MTAPEGPIISRALTSEHPSRSRKAWDGTAPLPLGPAWALGADNLQWMVLRARKHKGQTKWQPVSFVRSNKRVLRRVLREVGARLFPAGEAALNALNETYGEWRAGIPRESADPYMIPVPAEKSSVRCRFECDPAPAGTQLHVHEIEKA